MKLDKFKLFLEKQYESPDRDDEDEDDESYYNSDDYLFGRPYRSTKSKNYEEDEDNNPPASDSDGMDNICELIRDMFSLSGISAYVESDDLDINVSVEMNKKDKLKRLLKVLEISKRLQKEVLVEYECEFELWETKKDKRPLLVFNFYATGEAPF